MRALIESYALFIIPLAAFINMIPKFKIYFKIPAITFVILFSVLSYYNFYKYRHGTIHYDSTTKESYIKYFFKKYPDLAYCDLLEEPDYYAAAKGIYKTKEK